MHKYVIFTSGDLLGAGSLLIFGGGGSFGGGGFAGGTFCFNIALFVTEFPGAKNGLVGAA